MHNEFSALRRRALEKIDITSKVTTPSRSGGFLLISVSIGMKAASTAVKSGKRYSQNKCLVLGKCVLIQTSLEKY